MVTTHACSFCVWSWVSFSVSHPSPTSGLAGVFPEASSHGCCRRLKVWILNPLERIILVGKNSEECSVMKSLNEKEVNTKWWRGLFSSLNILSHAEYAWVKCDTLNEKNVRRCASSQMYCLHSPSRSGQLSLSWREIQKKTTTNQQLRLLSCWKSVKNVKTTVRLCDWCWRLPTCRSKPDFTSFLMLGSTSWGTWVDVVSSYHFSDHVLSVQSYWCQFEVQEDEAHQDDFDFQEEEDVDWGRSSTKYSVLLVLSHSRYRFIEWSSWLRKRCLSFFWG